MFYLIHYNTTTGVITGVCQSNELFDLTMLSSNDGMIWVHHRDPDVITKNPDSIQTDFTVDTGTKKLVAV